MLFTIITANIHAVADGTLIKAVGFFASLFAIFHFIIWQLINFTASQA